MNQGNELRNECGFFTSNNGDRKYTADDFCAFFSDFYTDGILAKNLGGFRTVPSGKMQVEVKDGTAYIQGRWYRKLIPQVLDLAVSDMVYDRYDAVVIRCDYKQRLVYADIVTGVPSEDPQKPVPKRDEDAYELITAYIHVKANSYEITEADISDRRFDSSLCGVVTNVIKSVDTSDLFAQFEAVWNDFVAQLGDSDHVTINTEDAESKRKIANVREQLPFGSMFMMV